MKRIIANGLLTLISIFLTACAFKGNPYPNTDQTNETWPSYVQTSPNSWTGGADRWFLTGDPNVTEEENMTAPTKSAMSTMMVRVSDFDKIRVDGSFQVQIFGTYERNSVYLYGPNAEVRQVAVEVKGDTLCLHATDNASGKLGKVIVRVGIANLSKLTHMGCGRIEGRQLRSTGLELTSSGSGTMYLAGNVNLRRVSQTGTGTVNVFGANTPALDITTAKAGGVNVSGNIGLHNITHAGTNDINIIGANGGNLKVYSEGSGRIAINGVVNIREITSKDNTAVYAYCVRGDNLYVYASGKSKVGLAGRVNDLYIETSGVSQFLGRDLMTESSYARANNSSHINVAGNNKIYAAATDNSSVYFFGSPNQLSQFLSGNGTVIPIWSDRTGRFPMCGNYAGNKMYKDSCAAPQKMPRHARHKVNQYIK